MVCINILCKIFTNKGSVLLHIYYGLVPDNTVHRGNKATRVTTQGGLISPTLFNLIVDNVVCYWLVLTVKDQLVAQEIPVLSLGSYLGLFYADNGMV